MQARVFRHQTNGFDACLRRLSQLKENGLSIVFLERCHYVLLFESDELPIAERELFSHPTSIFYLLTRYCNLGLSQFTESSTRLFNNEYLCL